jgi:hypothetical protein
LLALPAGALVWLANYRRAFRASREAVRTAFDTALDRHPSWGEPREMIVLEWELQVVEGRLHVACCGNEGLCASGRSHWRIRLIGDTPLEAQLFDDQGRPIENAEGIHRIAWRHSVDRIPFDQRRFTVLGMVRDHMRWSQEDRAWKPYPPA